LFLGSALPLPVQGGFILHSIPQRKGKVTNKISLLKKFCPPVPSSGLDFFEHLCYNPPRESRGKRGTMRKQFTFYRSFYEALSIIQDKAERADAMDAICRYALDGVPPELSQLSESGRIAMVLIRPVLDTAARRAESGKKGGLASPSGSGGQAKDKQTASPDKQSPRENENEKELENELENETEKEPEGDTPRRGDGSPREKTALPALEEVRAYCAQRGKGVDPEQWFDYYASNGWMVGKNPMRDWKAAVRNWERTEYRGRREPPKYTNAPAPGRTLTPAEQEARNRALEENQAELKALLAQVGLQDC
jgi:hypothetical protein